MSLSRRSVMKGFAAVSFLRALQPVWAQTLQAEHGRVSPPVPLPDLALVMADGTKSSLHRVLDGKATAIQLMFTTCRATCPMEGAVFERVQELVPRQVERGLQMMSLSISVDGEKPGALAEWMRHYHAKPGWVAASPALGDLAEIATLFGQGRSVRDPHTTQVQMIDRHGRLFWKSPELPSPEEVAGMLSRL